jgi:hypothetical protein
MEILQDLRLKWQTNHTTFETWQCTRGEIRNVQFLLLIGMVYRPRIFHHNIRMLLRPKSTSHIQGTFHDPLHIGRKLAHIITQPIIRTASKATAICSSELDSTTNELKVQYRKSSTSNIIHVASSWGPYSYETSKFLHVLDNRLTDGGEVVWITCRPCFTSKVDSWYSFLLEVESPQGRE